ncbi:MAG: glycosyltransferase [Chromatiales bacterium]|nr:glycosyltransferase [Chromatiales bacterium]
MASVSIILNVYNGISTLKETLDSVISQTWGDWELIFWDDGSVDGSADLLSEYSDPRIRYFPSKSDGPAGLGAARRMALEHATGDWVAFVDQDDLWHPQKLEWQMALTGEEDVGLIYGRTLTFGTGKDNIDYDHRHEYQALPEGDIFQQLFVDSCFIAISSTLFSRKAIESVDPIPVSISVSPDYYLYLAIAKKYTVRAVQNVICYYRLHAGNMSHYSGIRMQTEILELIDCWQDNITPDLAKRRRKVHNTVLALHQIRGGATRLLGIRTLFMQGSIPYLLSRPFARLYRYLRRFFVMPHWKRYADMTNQAG